MRKVRRGGGRAQKILQKMSFNVLVPTSAAGIWFCTLFCFSLKQTLLFLIYTRVITPYYLGVKVTVSASFLDKWGVGIWGEGRQYFLFSLQDIFSHLLQNYDSDSALSNVYPPVFPRRTQSFYYTISHGRLLSSIFWKIWRKAPVIISMATAASRVGDSGLADPSWFSVWTSAWAGFPRPNVSTHKYL